MGRHPVDEEDLDEDVEGARSFAYHLATIADGDINRDCSEELRDLLNKMVTEASAREATVKGVFRLELAIEVSDAGMVGIAPSIKTKAPEKKRRGAGLWVTKGGNLSYEHPRQQLLPGLREVTGGRREAPREVAQERASAKEV